MALAKNREQNMPLVKSLVKPTLCATHELLWMLCSEFSNISGLSEQSQTE